MTFTHQTITKIKKSLILFIIVEYTTSTNFADVPSPGVQKHYPEGEKDILGGEGGPLVLNCLKMKHFLIYRSYWSIHLFHGQVLFVFVLATSEEKVDAWSREFLRFLIHFIHSGNFFGK